MKNNIYGQALVAAAENGDIGILSSIITQPFFSSEGAFYLVEALDNAIENSQNEAAIILINNRNTNINYTDNNRKTYLMKATLKGNITLCNALTDQSVDILAQDEDGNSALMLAVINRNLSLVLTLSYHPMFEWAVKQRNNRGETPLMLLASSQRPGVLEKFMKEFSKITSERDIQKAIKIVEEESAKTKDCKIVQDELEIAKILLKNGAEVNAQDKDSRTTLVHSCNSGLDDLSRLLLQIPYTNVKLSDAYFNTAHSLSTGKPDILALIEGRQLCDLLDEIEASSDEQKEVQKDTNNKKRKNFVEDIQSTKENTPLNTPKKKRLVEVNQDALSPRGLF